MNTEIVLKYLGGGYLPGVPVTDIDADTLKRIEAETIVSYETLIASGLYSPAQPTETPATPATTPARARKGKE